MGVAKGPAGQHILVRIAPARTSIDYTVGTAYGGGTYGSGGYSSTASGTSIGRGEPITVPAPDDLRFSTTLPGGFDKMSCTIDWPAGRPVPEALSGLAEVWVLDRRTGSALWYGKLTDPGQATTRQGSTFAVTAEGSQLVADAWRSAYGLIDRDPNSWAAVGDYPGAQQNIGANDVPAASTDVAGFPITGALRETIPAGTGFNAAVSSWIYLHAGAVYRLIGRSRPNITNGGIWNEVYLATPTSGGLNVVESYNWIGGGASDFDFDVQQGDPSWPAGDLATVIYLRYTNRGGTTTFTQDILNEHGSIVVMHRRYFWDGLISGTQGAPYIQTFEVVYDLMGRGFGTVVEYDPYKSAANINEQIGHATWWDSASARDVLDFCVANSPQMWWGVFEPGITGRPKFFLGQWDSPARYVFTPGSAEVKLSGGVAGLANRCIVQYKSPIFGKAVSVKTVTASLAVPQLDDVGEVRTMKLDLTGDNSVGSSAVALARGVAALQLAAQARLSGSVVITKPILDRVTGRMVQPWEIRAGSPVVVTEAPMVFSRNGTAAGSVSEDGIGVFRATAVAYDASSGAATLTLDGGDRSIIDRVRVATTQRAYAVGDTRTT